MVTAVPIVAVLHNEPEMRKALSIAGVMTFVISGRGRQTALNFEPTP